MCSVTNRMVLLHARNFATLPTHCRKNQFRYFEVHVEMDEDFADEIRKIEGLNK